MNKILVTIHVLGLETDYDILLPINEMGKNVLEMIQHTIEELSQGAYVYNQNAVLINSDGSLINLNNNIKFSGLKNGSKVLMV